MKANQKHYLTDADLKEKAPAIFATKPALNVSKKYTFIPTNEVIADIKRCGWYPVRATQVGTRKEGAEEHNYHEVVFRAKEDLNVELDVNDIIIELVMGTDHKGLSSNVLHLAAFRKVCSNGLIIKDKEIQGMKVVHMNNTFEQVEKIIKNFVRNLPDVAKNINKYKKVKLTQKQRISFAKKAVALRYSDEKYKVDYKKFIEPKRKADEHDDLWTVFNVIQEHLFQGGVDLENKESGKNFKTRPINDIYWRTKINEKLWGTMVATQKGMK